MRVHTFYFSLESGEFVCTETTSGCTHPNGARLVCCFAQYLFNLAH